LSIPEIEILKILREWNKVEVILLKDIDRVETATSRLEYAKAGDKIKVPLWMAKKLIDKGIATIDVEKMISWIHRVHWREKVQKTTEFGISKLPREFYTNAELLLYTLKNKPEIFHEISDDLKKSLLDKLKEIVNKRIAIIPLLSDIEDTELIDRLTDEEKVLLNLYKAIISSWRKFIEV